MVVKAAQNALSRERLIILNELAGQACFGEGTGVEEFGEPAPIIAEPGEMHQFDVPQGSFEYLHKVSLASVVRAKEIVTQEGT